MTPACITMDARGRVGLRGRTNVFGRDDIGPAVNLIPELTSVTVPFRQVGFRAMELALSDVDSRIVPIATNVLLR
ncbi:hypothetical protein AQJ84_27330 [Streptomyces resistomycificus]|uniref:Uncharacterized protein n=1 Tax=Streptomyces resistomycificus TaxID=67356 RepID=A0A0L8L4J2_9ACTN|nr:hypothetical protein ADK37_24530 [Streptomyces resistomycificus]KUN94392.1 hypothetical protein AQJ84_27330 [Streptomyces resistomycificus]